MTDGLRLQDFCLRIGGVELFNLSFGVADGEVLSLTGPSGSGKSSLLAALLGTLPQEFQQSGTAYLNDTNILELAPHRRKIGVLMQDPMLFPHLSVGQNLAFGLTARRRDRKPAIAKALADVGLAGFEDRDPATLSGGQAARVALQRCLLSEPACILLDEPFSKLDPSRRDAVRNLVFVQIKKNGTPALLVSHDEVDCDAAGGPRMTIGG